MILAFHFRCMTMLRDKCVIMRLEYVNSGILASSSLEMTIFQDDFRYSDWSVLVVILYYRLIREKLDMERNSGGTATVA